MAVRRSLRWRTVALAALAIAGLVVVVWLIGTSIRGSSPLAIGCGEGPTDPKITVEKYPEIFKYPYGDVTSCRELDRRPHLFGSADVSVYLLLDTQHGLVAVRVDYRDLNAGRQYSAHATELAANNLPSGLSQAEVARLTADIAARGGIRTDDWVLRYGDG